LYPQDPKIAGQNTSPHVKYIAVVKGARWIGICDRRSTPHGGSMDKKFPEKYRDYSLEEDLG
jgi:hypothetical protein